VPDQINIRVWAGQNIRILHLITRLKTGLQMRVGASSAGIEPQFFNLASPPADRQPKRKPNHEN
jgi:hypothetical protein